MFSKDQILELYRKHQKDLEPMTENDFHSIIHLLINESPTEFTSLAINFIIEENEKKRNARKQMGGQNEV